MLETNFGPIAHDGDYVLVVDFNWMKRRCNTYVAQVYHGKAYTGVKDCSTGKYIHKLQAECVIPADYVNQNQKEKILQDIIMYNGESAIKCLKLREDVMHYG